MRKMRSHLRKTSASSKLLRAARAWVRCWDIQHEISRGWSAWKDRFSRSNIACALLFQTTRLGGDLDERIDFQIVNCFKLITQIILSFGIEGLTYFFFFLFKGVSTSALAGDLVTVVGSFRISDSCSLFFSHFPSFSLYIYGDLYILETRLEYHINHSQKNEMFGTALYGITWHIW